MANIKVTEIRKGMVVVIDGELYQVLKYEHITPGNWRAINHVYMRNLRTGGRKDMRLNSSATLETAFLEKKPCSFLFKDAAGAHFMESESFEQFFLEEDIIADYLPFITEETPVAVTFHEGTPVSVDLPAAVELKVVEAEEAIRGDTATNVTKNATVETGLVVKVPNHIKRGDRIKISTENGDFLGRVN